MKKMDDEELQKWIEENKAVNKTGMPVSDDAKVYRFLFDVLDTAPLKDLPFDFSAKVTRRVQAKVRRSSELKYYLIGVVVFIIVVAGIYALLGSVKPGAIATPYVTALLQYKWVFILGIFSFLTIQYLDVVLVKRNVFKR